VRHATLFSNVVEECRVRQQDRAVVLAGLGLFGIPVATIQMLSFELKSLSSLTSLINGQTSTQNAEIILLIFGFSVCLYAFYLLAPVLFRLSGATFFNLSLLAADVYGLVFAVFVLNADVTLWFPIAYVFIVSGIIVYSWNQPKPEADVVDTKPLPVGTTEMASTEPHEDGELAKKLSRRWSLVDSSSPVANNRRSIQQPITMESTISEEGLFIADAPMIPTKVLRGETV